jgi:DNA repair protein RadC
MEALRENLAILRELAMRYEVSSFRGRPVVRGRRIHQPQDAGKIVAPEMEPLVQEQLRVLLLDTKNRLIGQHLVYQGNVNSTLVRPAEVFREAVLEAAPKVILAHNHPSGDPEPSNEDIHMTGFLLEAGRILGIEVLDHLIVGQGTVVSMRARGLPRGVTWPS